MKTKGKNEGRDGEEVGKEGESLMTKD